jgi:signal transduction histidine kinase
VHDLSLYLLELLENSVRAGAKQVEVGLLMDQGSDELRLTVDDDGDGFSASPERTLDPFYTTKADKKTGLGLSLLKADAQATGGDLVIGPSPTLGGARVEAHMGFSHVDRVPLGDLGSTISVTAFTNPEVQFVVNLTGDQFRPPLQRGSPVAAATRLAHKPATPTDRK